MHAREVSEAHSEALAQIAELNSFFCESKNSKALLGEDEAIPENQDWKRIPVLEILPETHRKIINSSQRESTNVGENSLKIENSSKSMVLLARTMICELALKNIIEQKAYIYIYII